MGATTQVADIAALRRFNRGYTRSLGLLQSDALYALSLPQARVLYEIAHGDGVIAREIGEALGLNPGYLSRLIGELRRDGLVVVVGEGPDARRRPLYLTAEGRATFAKLDQVSERQVAAMLAPLHPLDRAAAVAGLEQAERLWRIGPSPQVALRQPLPGDLGWMVERQSAYYADTYGWGALLEAGCAESAARFVRQFDPASDRGFIAERAGERLGSLLVTREKPTTARIRLVMVEPKARGLGLGKRLVEAAIAFAREAGYRHMTLWTHSVLTDARRLYHAAGFRMASQAMHHEFGVPVMGET